ncbi:MAG: rod shape-determining protein MreD [Alphaproteobacteria bacterium]|nr:rod shape-determining protein MreD [Pseudomonadota bacterium]
MSLAWWSRLGVSLRGLVPFTLGLVFVFITVAPWRLPGLDPVMPMFALTAVFYWSVYRPDWLPYTATFTLGLIQDLLSGTPIGMTALIFLVVQAVVVSQRRFFLKRSFLVMWWGFVMVAPAAAFTGWFVSSLVYGGVVPVEPVIVQLLLTVLFYPPLTWILGRFHNLITDHA